MMKSFKFACGQGWSLAAVLAYVVGMGVLLPVEESLHRMYIRWAEGANARLGRVWDGEDYSPAHRPTGPVERLLYAAASAAHAAKRRVGGTRLCVMHRWVPNW